MSSPETLEQFDAAPSVIQIPENLDPGKRIELDNIWAGYNKASFGSAVGFKGLLKKLGLGGGITKASYKALILETLLNERSVDLVDLRQIIEDDVFGFEVDQTLWSEAASEVKNEIQGVLDGN